MLVFISERISKNSRNERAVGSTRSNTLHIASRERSLSNEERSSENPSSSSISVMYSFPLKMLVCTSTRWKTEMPGAWQEG
ncbi:MAG: hypothetical protein A3F09_00565 [Chlamydiae bacterium RIFCSPHIGHO2_12_FULL_49_11]|nr:MAG: hypothetical protein A3F09_00565 [Chlamydiae bacterium RIFCSPHIGHO2_12_FULL_49_11]